MGSDTAPDKCPHLYLAGFQSSTGPAWACCQCNAWFTLLPWGTRPASLAHDPQESAAAGQAEQRGKEHNDTHAAESSIVQGEGQQPAKEGDTKDG